MRPNRFALAFASLVATLPLPAFADATPANGVPGVKYAPFDPSKTPKVFLHASAPDPMPAFARWTHEHTALLCDIDDVETA